MTPESFLTQKWSFYQDYPPQLERLQAEHWDPLLEWARKLFDVTITKSESILAFSQPKETKEKFSKVLETFDEWEMAGMIINSKSLFISSSTF